MKANELRIGNYVNSGGVDCYINFFLGGEFADLELIGFEYTDDNHEELIERLQPIQLTEEWLVKFGKNKVSHIMGLDLFGDNKRGFHYANNETGWICIKYVHQLQNLYFALTNEELVIKKDN